MDSDLFGGKLPQAISYTTADGRQMSFAKRGKHYVEPRGYYAPPGTGPEGETCKTCKHHVVRQYSKRYHKCALAQARWTGGRSSDILTRAHACKGWEGGKDESTE